MIETTPTLHFLGSKYEPDPGMSEPGPARGVHGRREERAEAKRMDRLELGEEEKAVLMECRRNSVARGVLLTAGSVVTLRTLLGTGQHVDWCVPAPMLQLPLLPPGRIPLHVQRWSSVYYTAVGVVSFLAGMRSYHQRCVDKLMSLEHSVLADQLRQHQRKQQGWTEEEVVLVPPPRLPSSTPSPPHTSPITPPQLSERDTVASDKHFSSAGQDEPSGDQPDAFDISNSSGGVPDIYEATPSKTRGRTFDEIREDNRRRQLQRYPRSRSGVGGEDSGKSVRVRRNKYGDIVSED